MSEAILYEEGKLKIPCLACKKTNSVLLEKIGKGPKCGSCGKDLEAPGGTVQLDDENFTDFIQRSPVPVLVDFWAPWCGPCRMMGPVLENFARKKAGKAIVAKLDTDKSPLTPRKFNIQAIPTLIAFSEGKESGRKVGAVPESDLDTLLSS